MKRTTRMHRAAWVVLMLPLVAIATTFQNCSKVDFVTTVDASKSGIGEKKTMYQEAVVGQANVPPLKLVFVVDNSFTMQANQISLSAAFGSMFAGNNASNLAPFDSTAYIFTTAQGSLAKSNPAFPLLPTISYDQMRTMNATDLASLRGSISQQVDGKFAGDLVSYSVSNLPDPVTLLNRLAYIPTPVLGINSTGSDVISLGAHKDKTGSVSDFAADFGQRISYISPTRSQVNAAGQGPLDPVIDKESALCALARVLKNNSNFLQKGDLAAYVIVSDENDNDPSGANCVDAYQDYKDADLIDAHCETPQTKISYNAPNSATPTCSFNYQRGFTYTANYSAPITKLAFNDYNHTNKNAQTTVSYNTVSYTYTNYKYNVHWFSTSPTYKVPQVNVSWFTKSTTYKVRDGVQYDPTVVYTPMSATVQGTYNGTNCSTFSASVASGAVTGDAAHPISCAQGTPIAKSGACSANDSSNTDCNQNYKQENDITLYSDSSNSQCSALIAGKLGANAIYSGVAGYNPSCDAPVANAKGGSGNGTCGSQPGCAESVKAETPKKVAVSFDGSASSCSAAVSAARLPSNAVTTGANAPTCADSSYLDSNPSLGKCVSPLPASVVSCSESQQVDSSGASASGSPSGNQTCQQFASASGALPSYAIPSSVTCSASSTPSSASGVVAYDASNYPGLVVKNGDSCPSDILASVKSTYGATATCAITSVDNPGKSYNDTCANSASSIASFCSGANHGCTTPTDNNSSVNQPYQTAVSTKTVSGTITCDTKCSDSNGACDTVTTGLVRDYRHNCSSAPDTMKTSNPQTGVLASMKDSLCQAPAKVVVEKSYQRNGTTTQFVAGSASANGDPNALINYIKSRSQELLGAELPATSVFVRQADGGNGGTKGTAYQSFATAMGGSNYDVTSPASVYASSLQSLSGVIKDKLSRSFSIKDFQADQVVTRAWLRAAGSSDWIEKQEGKDWTASGGTVTVTQSLDIHTGDSFRFEYK
jgi:hypothetical protein